MYLLLIFVMSLFVPLAVLPGMIKRGMQSPYRIVLYAALSSSAAALLVLIVASASGESVYGQISAAVNEMAGVLADNETMIDVLGMKDITAGERTDLIVKLYQETFKALPASIMTFNAVVAYFEYILLSRIMKNANPGVRLMPKFREFTLPGGAIWGIIIMYMVSWLMTSAEMLSDDLLYVNMDLIFDFVLSLQGISVVFMLFHMKKLPKAVAVIIIIVLWGTYMGRWMLVLLGMFDILLGLKTRIQSGRSGR